MVNPVSFKMINLQREMGDVIINLFIKNTDWIAKIDKNSCPSGACVLMGKTENKLYIGLPKNQVCMVFSIK